MIKFANIKNALGYGRVFYIQMLGGSWVFFYMIFLFLFFK